MSFENISDTHRRYEEVSRDAIKAVILADPQTLHQLDRITQEHRCAIYACTTADDVYQGHPEPVRLASPNGPDRESSAHLWLCHAHAARFSWSM